MVVMTVVKIVISYKSLYKYLLHRSIKLSSSFQFSFLTSINNLCFIEGSIKRLK